MARDLGEQERAFVTSLKEDTGRDLSGWMSAIAECGHSRRNDIIDWLRVQGFTFANASWLERIHHNGGQLIYGDDGTSTEPVASTSDVRVPPARDISDTEHSKIEPEKTSEAAPDAKPSLSRSFVAAPKASAPVTAASDQEIASLLLAAKGLRPLAELILREVDALVPTLVQTAEPPLITIASPMPFAALLTGPKDLRLFADFGPGSRDRTRKADTGRVSTPFPDVLVLNDARQIDDRFRELIAAAYTRALQ
ncbi:MAG: hypothetical protein AB7S74_06820 [Hyphomicrobium sp.]